MRQTINELVAFYSWSFGLGEFIASRDAADELSPINTRSRARPRLLGFQYVFSGRKLGRSRRNRLHGFPPRRARLASFWLRPRRIADPGMLGDDAGITTLWHGVA